MADFQRQIQTVNGVKTVVLTAGRGEPLVFLHGAGTFHGFEFAKPWAEKFRVVIPFHPGFGESGDDPTMTDLHDYVMHYLELFDALGLDVLPPEFDDVPDEHAPSPIASRPTAATAASPLCIRYFVPIVTFPVLT